MEIIPLKKNRNEGVGDAEKCRQILVELVQANAGPVQAMADEAATRFTDEEGGYHGCFFDGYMLGGATVMMMFAEGDMSVPKIRRELARRI
jgi:hypothetical protein